MSVFPLLQFTMSENNQKDGYVGTIQANDSDIGSNALLRYSLAEGDRTHFQMVTISSPGKLDQGELRVFAVSRKIFEPHSDKPCLCHMRTTKAQISLRIRAV